MRTCTVDNCGKPLRTLKSGLCQKHFYRLKRHGSLDKPTRPKEYSDPRERFWGKVDKSGDCWNWLAGKSAAGYGTFHYKGKDRKAHRVSYTWAKGEIPQGLQIDHVCRNTSCVRPDHLRLATNKQNQENRIGTTSKSGYRNVFEVPGGRAWKVSISHHGVKHYFGTYYSLEEAAKVAERARIQLHSHYIPQ